MTSDARKRTGRMLAIAVITGVLFTGVRSASAEIINAGDILRIEFKVDNAWTPVPPDVLRLNFGLIDVLSQFTTRIAELYDGNTLLGTASTSSFGNHVGLLNLDPSNSWKTAGSLWDFDSPGIADFGPILDGTIDGRIDFTIATGSVDIPLNQINLNFIMATGPASGIVVNPSPQINSIQILPTPGALWLLAVIPMASRRRRRN